MCLQKKLPAQPELWFFGITGWRILRDLTDPSAYDMPCCLISGLPIWRI
jgi:hypothetical protein